MSLKIPEIPGGHEGYAAPVMPDGTIATNGQRPAFVGYVAACACGWTDGQRFPATEAGRKAAEAEWSDKHVRTLIVAMDDEMPRDLGAKATVLRNQIVALIGRRPRAALRTLAYVESWQQALLDQAVAAARAGGQSWAEIGLALGITKQAAHERFRDRTDF
jgi:hypothetical protein